MAKDLEQEIPLRGSNSKVIHSADIENNNNSSSSAAAAAGGGGLSSSLQPRPKVYKKWSPWLIVLVVIANVVMFIITMYVNNCPKYSLSCVASSFGRFSFQPFKENPLLGPSSSTLEKMGALDVNKVVHHNQGWRLISCIWLHGGVFHLLANMLSLLIIGIRLEREFGFIKIGLLYMIAGLGGSLMSALFVRSSISVGASGAVFGLLGAMLSELIINWTIYRNKISSLIMLILIVVINLGVGILPHVDNFAHIGGFISGFFLGFVFLIRPQFGWIGQNYMLPGHSRNGPRHKYKIYQCALWIISLIVLIVGFVVALILLFKGVDANAKCSWCHYLSCVPTSRWSCNTQPVYCTSEQMDNQLNLTCPSNGKSKTYFMPNLTESQIRGLCTELCG